MNALQVTTALNVSQILTAEEANVIRAINAARCQYTDEHQDYLSCSEFLTNALSNADRLVYKKDAVKQIKAHLRNARTLCNSRTDAAIEGFFDELHAAARVIIPDWGYLLGDNPGADYITELPWGQLAEDIRPD